MTKNLVLCYHSSSVKKRHFWESFWHLCVTCPTGTTVVPECTCYVSFVAQDKAAKSVLVWLLVR